MNHVQHGCGHQAAGGWQNFDSSPTLNFERLPLPGRFCKKSRMRDYKAMQHELANAVETPHHWTNCLGVQCLRALCPL